MTRGRIPAAGSHFDGDEMQKRQCAVRYQHVREPQMVEVNSMLSPTTLISLSLCLLSLPSSPYPHGAVATTPGLGQHELAVGQVGYA